MLGVLVNTVAVLLGSLIGLFCKKGIPERVEKAVMTAIALCTVYMGVSGALGGKNTLVMILSMIVGTAVGTLLDIDGGISRLGDWVENRFKRNPNDSISVAEGFVTASLLFCVGAMTIVGSLNSGLHGDHSLIFTKSLLDLFSSIMLAASLGIGVLCSAAVVFVVQGALVMLSQLIAPMLTTASIAEITCVGSLMILALGLNLLGVTKIKVANMLPAMLVAPPALALYQWIAAMTGGLL